MLLVNYKIKLLKEQSKNEQAECVKFVVNIHDSEIGDTATVNIF